MQTDNMLLYERTGCRGRWNNRMVVVVLSFLAGVSLSPTFSDMNHMSKAESCTVPEVHTPTATLALFLRQSLNNLEYSGFGVKEERVL